MNYIATFCWITSSSLTHKYFHLQEYTHSLSLNIFEISNTLFHNFLHFQFVRSNTNQVFMDYTKFINGNSISYLHVILKTTVPKIIMNINSKRENIRYMTNRSPLSIDLTLQLDPCVVIWTAFSVFVFS